MRAADAFQVTWSGPFVSDTSPNYIDREDLGRRRIGTWQSLTVKADVLFEVDFELPDAALLF